jgi:hypothetical protein
MAFAPRAVEGEGNPPSMARPEPGPGARQRTRGAVTGKTYVLLVAVNNYENYPDLVNPVQDAQAIEKELREVYKCETTLLRNPTRNEFRTTLYGLADRKYGAQDQLLVYFSGHGWFDERLKRGFLALRDSKPLSEDRLRDSLVPHEDVRTILERLDCKHVLVVVDSCFSGTLDPLVAMASNRASDDVYDQVTRSEYIQRKLSYQTRRYITAGGKEYVSDGRPGSHSPFSRQLLAALRTYGGADGILTLEEILLQMDKVTPQPRAGELLGNEPGSSFVLIAKPLTESEQPAEPARPKMGNLTVVVTPGAAEATLEPLDGTMPFPGPTRALRVRPDDKKWRFRVPTGKFGVPVGKYRLYATLDGYQEATRDIEIKESDQTVTITLTKKP